MTVARYPAYKDSGVAWLGEVPSEWTVAALSYRYQVMLGKMLDEKRVTGEHLAPYLRNVDVQWDRINTEELPQMDFAGEDLSRYRLARGDLLVCEGGEVGRAAIWQDDIDECYYQKALHRLRRHDHGADVPRFMFYLLRAATDAGAFAANEAKSTIAHLTAEALRRHRFGFPSRDEQERISEFLDRETAKIDALIAEQQRLIELLAEKRQAVISQAVTKGLNPAAPMKDSGIEWLGEVPAHWELMQVKRDTYFITSGSRGWAEHYSEDGDLFIRIGNLTRDSTLLDLNEIQRVEAPTGSEGERTKTQAGDVLVSITAYLGSVAVVPRELESAYVSQHIALVRLIGKRLTPEWAAYVVLSRVGQTFLEMQGYGGTKVQLSLGDIACMPMPCPPLMEQRKLVSQVELLLRRFDQLAREVEGAIGLLQERRTALISAAVTGQIDVRQPSPDEIDHGDAP